MRIYRLWPLGFGRESVVGEVARCLTRHAYDGGEGQRGGKLEKEVNEEGSKSDGVAAKPRNQVRHYLSY